MPAKSLPEPAVERPGAPPAAPRRWRRRIGLLGLGLVLLLAAHGMAWAWLAAELEAGVAAWVRMRRAEGWQVAHGPPVRGGWPLVVTLRLPDAGMQRDGTGWRAAHMVLSLAPTAPDRLRVAPKGAIAVTFGGATVPLTAPGLRAEVPLGADAEGLPGLPRDAWLSADAARIDLPAGPVMLGALRIDLATAPAASAEASLATLRAAIARLTLPPALLAMPGLGVLGPNLDRLGLELVVAGPWPGLAGAPVSRATRWRDGGGLLEVRSLAFDWGAASASASATLALDEALQPAGEGLLRLAGAPAVLQAAQEAGLVGRRDALAAQMLLAMMQRTPPEGGPPRLEVPLVLDKRSLSAAGLTLTRLPALPWPAPPSRRGG